MRCPRRRRRRRRTGPRRRRRCPRWRRWRRRWRQRRWWRRWWRRRAAAGADPESARAAAVQRRRSRSLRRRRTLARSAASPTSESSTSRRGGRTRATGRRRTAAAAVPAEARGPSRRTCHRWMGSGYAPSSEWRSGLPQPDPQHERSLSSSHSAAAGGGVFVASMPQHVVVQRERTQESACAHKPLSLALSHCDAPPAAVAVGRAITAARAPRRLPCLCTARRARTRRRATRRPRDATALIEINASTRRNSARTWAA